MRHFTRFAGGLGLVALLVTFASAQQPPASPDGKATPPARMMGMHGMMAKCQDHADLKASVASALAKVREAQVSTDPVAVKAALGDADRTLAAVQDHFGKCAAMMEKMKGGASEPPAAPATPPDEHKH